MGEEAKYDYGPYTSNTRRSSISCTIVLTSDYAVLLAEEFGRNPIVNDEAAFDIYPLFVSNFLFDAVAFSAIHLTVPHTLILLRLCLDPQ